MEVLQRIEHLRRILYLIKDQQRLARQDLLPTRHRQIRHDAMHILRRPEELPVFRILIKVEIRRILIVAPPQFLEQPRLADLTDPLQDQRLPIGRLLPSHKPLHHQSLHANHLFIYNYVISTT